jgi:nicotinic acid mononucleotide adenylyltransferase
MVDVSASRIRAAVRLNGQSLGQSDDGTQLREMVPAAVASYIEKYDLYRN